MKTFTAIGMFLFLGLWAISGAENTARVEIRGQILDLHSYMESGASLSKGGATSGATSGEASASKSHSSTNAPDPTSPTTQSLGKSQQLVLKASNGRVYLLIGDTSGVHPYHDNINVEGELVGKSGLFALKNPTFKGGGEAGQSGSAEGSSPSSASDKPAEPTTQQTNSPSATQTE